MKRITGLLMFVGLLFAAVNANAAIIASSTMTATATVASVNTSSFSVKNVADNTYAADTIIAFGSQPSGGLAWATTAQQYVRIAVDDNAASWKIRTYTNNFTAAPSTAAWGTQFGGMRAVASTGTISMGWIVQSSAPAAGVVPMRVGSPSDSATNGWLYFKDKADTNDAGSDNYITADSGGYTTVVYGSASFTRLSLPNAAGGSEALINRTDPFYVYCEGDFSSAPAASYSGNIVFELFHP